MVVVGGGGERCVSENIRARAPRRVHTKRSVRSVSEPLWGDVKGEPGGGDPCDCFHEDAETEAICIAICAQNARKRSESRGLYRTAFWKKGHARNLQRRGGNGSALGLGRALCLWCCCCFCCRRCAGRSFR